MSGDSDNTDTVDSSGPPQSNGASSVFGRAYLAISSVLQEPSDWFERRNFFSTLLFGAIAGTLLEMAVSPVAESLFVFFWEKKVVLQGSVYISGVPVPLNLLVYIGFVLIVMNMLETQFRRKRIDQLE